MRSLFIFLIILIPGLVFIPSLQTTAHYRPEETCRTNRRIFKQVLEQYQLSSSDPVFSEVTANNHDQTVKAIVANKKEIGLSENFDVEKISRCPSSGLPFLTTHSSLNTSEIIVCCARHPEPADEANVTLPAFPVQDPNSIEKKEAEYYNKFLRSKHPFGLDSTALAAILTVFAALMAFLFRSKENSEP